MRENVANFFLRKSILIRFSGTYVKDIQDQMFGDFLENGFYFLVCCKCLYPSVLDRSGYEWNMPGGMSR